MRRRCLPTVKTSTLVSSALARDGAPIDLRWAEDFELPNRGFVSHEASAWQDGRRVGYLRVGYVPAAHLEVFLPTVWHHMSSFGGSSLGWLFSDPFGTAIHPTMLDGESFAAFRQKACFLLRIKDSGWTDYASMMAALSAHPSINERCARFAAFRAFHVDKPLVDYANTRQSVVNGVLSNNTGRGIGLMLYAATAQVLATKRMRLHASGLQSDDAKRLWALFAARGWSKRRGKRVVLDPAAMPGPADVLGAVSCKAAA